MADSKAHVELQAEVVRLAELSLLEYDQVRERAAEEMGVRVSTLDAEVKKARAAAEGDADQQGKAIEVHEAEPWADKVDIAELLDDIDDTVHHYVVLPKKAADAVTLWIAGTYTLDAAAFAARLYLFSPVKRCGKTTLLTVITRLAHRALPGSNISAAALFRTIEAVQPTLIIDEADTLTMSDELRSILNSGHSRDLAFVIRTCGEDHEPRQFSTFALLAIATKSKRLPDTVEDRSIGIGMRRRGANEDKPPRLPPRGKGEFAKLRRKLARWHFCCWHTSAGVRVPTLCRS